MSRNFELMQQVGRGFEAPSIPEPSRVFSKVHEEARPRGARYNLGQVAREETLRLVQRIFSLQTQGAPRAILFTGIDRGTCSSQVCLLVAEALRSTVSGSVCLVEANFRSPSLSNLLGATNHRGLTDALVQEGPIRSFATPLQTDNVWLLSCGSVAPDSPSLLNSDRMKPRFDDLRKEFDYLLVDAPPVTQYADATTLGRLTDGLVLVLEANSARKEVAFMAMENLRAAQIHVLGAVLNKRTLPIPESLYQSL